MVTVFESSFGNYVRLNWTNEEVYVLVIVINSFYTAPRSSRFADSGSFSDAFGIYDYRVLTEYSFTLTSRIGFPGVPFDFPAVTDWVNNQP